jgi:dimethylaniline monooxygenase (N-oxide forming)
MGDFALARGAGAGVRCISDGVRIAVIGGGVSGVAAAAVLKRDGHDVHVYERGDTPGGVWAKTYPKVTLQNTAPQYHISDFPWPFAPSLHPTAEEIRRYIDLAIAHFGVHVRVRHEVTALHERPAGWRVTGRNGEGTFDDDVDFVLVAVGQYSQPKADLDLPGRERFTGRIVSEREIDSLEIFAGKRVAVIGMGKSGLDIAMLASEHGAASVAHVFRTPRWLLPEHIVGLVHFTHAMFSRVGSVMMTSWAQPTRAEALLHGRLRPIVDAFWGAVSRGVWHGQAMVALPRGSAARARVRRLRAKHPFISDMRSAAALVPSGYFRAVADGRLEPVHGQLLGFHAGGLSLRDGEGGSVRELGCDLVVPSLGASAPTFPFMPAPYRQMLEAEPDGVQLYRHLVHPRIPRLAFAGFNHGFLHIPLVEVGTLWIAALIAGELELPPAVEMEATIDRVRAWKRANVTFEPSRSCAVSTRHHQYLDILLQDLALSPYRKGNVLAEAVARYGAADYAGLLAEHQRRRDHGPLRLRPVALDN